MDQLLEHLYKLSATERKSTAIRLLNLLQTVPDPSSPKLTKGKYDHVDESKLSEKDNSLYDKLKMWRNGVARDLEVQAYMILDNKTLASIAYYKPTNRDLLLRIKGIGEEKADRYCDAIGDILSIKTTSARRLQPNKLVPTDE